MIFLTVILFFSRYSNTSLELTWLSRRTSRAFLSYNRTFDFGRQDAGALPGDLETCNVLGLGRVLLPCELECPPTACLLTCWDDLMDLTPNFPGYGFGFLFWENRTAVGVFERERERLVSRLFTFRRRGERRLAGDGLRFEHFADSRTILRSFSFSWLNSSILTSSDLQTLASFLSCTNSRRIRLRISLLPDSVSDFSVVSMPVTCLVSTLASPLRFWRGTPLDTGMNHVLICRARTHDRIR